MTRDALENVTIVDFGGYAAGPVIGTYLAKFGARVIHAESLSRPDGFRLQYPPFKEKRIGINRSGCFGYFNDSKFGITLDLKSQAGMDFAHRLIKRTDIVIENLRPGAIDRLGLGYERLRELNPSIIMMSTSNLGQTGPEAKHPGFGSQLSSLSGFTNLIGAPSGPPQFIYGPYIDFIAVIFGGAAILAALDRQRRTGEGAYIDLSQYECGLQFIYGPLLDYAVNGVVAHRQGNRDSFAVPHGCYRAKDNRWCVLSCWDEEEWRRLCHALGQTGWLNDSRIANAASRKQHEDVLNGLLSKHLLSGDAAAWMNLLQANNVHAAVVNTVRDLFFDPQLAARGVWQGKEHPEIGVQRYRMVAYQLSESPGYVRSAAPCLGQHNREVFRDWLGVDEKEMAAAETQGAFS